MNDEINNCLGLISINPERNLFYSNKENSLRKISTCEYNKNQFCISYLPTHAYINTQISISRNIDEEDLYDAIYTKVYDDLALDQAVSYEVQYIESFDVIDEKNRNFHIFITDPGKIAEIFEESIKSIKYIDQIIPLPLLLKTLYTKKLLPDSTIDAFLYFLEDDAFIAIYKDKEFLYAKSINDTFKQMHARFCELYAKQIEYDIFIDFIANENLKYSQSEYTISLIKLYKEIFTAINDILNFVKKTHSIDKINALYIGSQVFMQTKLDEIAELELNVRTYPFQFEYGFEISKFIDPLQYLMHLHVTDDENEKYNCNFTLYKRAPNFIKRQSGKMILLTAASFLIAFIYPLIYYSLDYSQSLKYNQLKQENKTLLELRKATEIKLKNKNAKKEKLLVLINDEKKTYKIKKETLLKIRKVKADYPMKAKIIYDLTKNFNQYDVMLDSLSYSESVTKKEFVFDLVSNKNREVTQLLEEITNRYKDKLAFTLNNIVFDKNSNKYLSKLTAAIL